MAGDPTKHPAEEPKQAHNASNGTPTHAQGLRLLSPDHRRMLLEGSGIAPELLEEYVRIVTDGHQLPKGFSRRQRRRAPGILFKGPRPNGETAYTFRPNESDPENPGHKYEQQSKRCGGPGNVLMVYTNGASKQMHDTHVPLIFVEGVKKALSLISAARAAGVELVVVAISGVWNWLSDGTPIPDMLEIPIEGRQVTVCFDSDMLTNPSVQDAARRLAEHLVSRGAEVFITYLPDQPDGSKTGADDFLAGGETFHELRLLTRRYDPADFAGIRLSRDAKLRALVEDLERRFWDFEWKGMGGHSARDVALKLIEAARQHGKAVGDGVRVVKAWGPLALEAKISSRTLSKAINRLEEWGFAYRDNEGREADKAGAFVLRADVKHYGEEQGREEKGSEELQERDPGTLHLRAPRLMWSRPKYTPRRGLVRGTCRVRQGPKPKTRPGIERLGKIRGAILDVLDSFGGTATTQEIAAALHRKRPRDIRRRNLPMLEEAGIVTVDGNAVSLADNWLDRLEEARELGEELAAEETARKRYENKSRAYHNRHKVKPNHHPANVGGDAWVEELEKLPTPPDPWSLYALVGKLVNTRHGPGVLWQVFGDEVRVVLDSDLSRWIALDPSELILEAA